MGKINCRLDCSLGWIKPGALITHGVKCPELRCPYNSYGIAGMKALSVIMPWPWLIMKHGKDVENRTWYTNYRGRILIHASKKPDPFLTEIVGRACSDKLTHDELKKLLSWCGNIVGTVELVDCVQNHKSKWAESGMWHWVLKKPVLFKEPIPARGSLGLWEYKEYGGKKC
jgi:hypothetical protein